MKIGFLVALGAVIGIALSYFYAGHVYDTTTDKSVAGAIVVVWLVMWLPMGLLGGMFTGGFLGWLWAKLSK